MATASKRKTAGKGSVSAAKKRQPAKKTARKAAKKGAKKSAAKKSAPKKAGKKSAGKKGAKKSAPKKAAKKSSGAKNKLGVKNSLVNNINARKKKGKARPKKKSTISKKSYTQMQNQWK